MDNSELLARFIALAKENQELWNVASKTTQSAINASFWFVIVTWTIAGMVLLSLLWWLLLKVKKWEAADEWAIIGGIIFLIAGISGVLMFNSYVNEMNDFDYQTLITYLDMLH